MLAAIGLLTAGCGDDAPTAASTTTLAVVPSTTATVSTPTTSTALAPTTALSPTATRSPPAGPILLARAWTGPVEVLDGGAEPRRVLRYGGDEDGLRLRIEHRIDGVPPSDVTLDLVVVADLGAGPPSAGSEASSSDTAVVFRGPIDVIAPEGGAAVTAVYDATDDEPHELRLAPSGDLELRRRGSPLYNEFVAAALVTMIAEVVPPLPVEPVGVGARWTAFLPDEPTGTLMNRTVEYTLVADRGDVIEVSVTTAGSGPTGCGEDSRWSTANPEPARSR